MKDQDATLTSVPRLICPVLEAEVLMSDGDGPIEPVGLPGVCFFFCQLSVYVVNNLNESPFPKSTGIFKSF